MNSQTKESPMVKLVEINKAYSNNELAGYKALELKGSHEEKSTCKLQWGPQMRT